MKCLVRQRLWFASARIWSAGSLIFLLICCFSARVYGANQSPVFIPQADTSVNQFQGLNFTVRASDFESTPTISATGLPTGALFVPLTNGTATFNWPFLAVTPTGIYRVFFYATDDSSAVDTMPVRIFVLSTTVNDAPFLDSTGAKNVTEGNNLSFGVSAFDGESTPTLSIDSLPTGASFIDNADGTGTFSWTPGYTQSGDFDIRFTASDGFASDSETILITVIDAGNQSPTINPISALTVAEGKTLSLLLTASDPESTPAITIDSLPEGASFVDSGNGIGLFTWTPSYTDSGSYSATVTATDDSGSVATTSLSISVTDSSLAGGLAASFINYPNPFTAEDGSTTLSFFLAPFDMYDVEIFTLTGERVITIRENYQAQAGPNQVEWDGTNGAGRAVIPGTYICQLTVRHDSGKTETARRKVAVLN